MRTGVRCEEQSSDDGRGWERERERARARAAGVVQHQHNVGKTSHAVVRRPNRRKKGSKPVGGDCVQRGCGVRRPGERCDLYKRGGWRAGVLLVRAVGSIGRGQVACPAGGMRD